MSSAIAEKEPDCVTSRLDELKVKPLEPLEFCRRWVKVPEDSKEWHRACVAALAEAANVSPRSIERWKRDFSNRPDYICTILRKEDLLNQIREKLNPPPKYLDE